MADTEALLEITGLTKRFGALTALDSADLVVAPGEVHCLLGENGAGKSTLCNLVFGVHAPDAGSMRFAGQPYQPVGPAGAIATGIAMVHQHFTLVPEFTVAENLALSGMKGLAKGLNVGKISRPALELAKDLNWNFDESAKTRLLPVGVQQRVEILKALAEDPQILVLDEPTAVLSPDEVEDLFRVLRQLKAL